MRTSCILPLIIGASAAALSNSTNACAGNSADDRSTWCGYDLSTNYYDEVPDTGVTVEYWLELTNVTAAPDGVSRNVLTVNGSFPGPTLEANWGDNVVVHVRNSLTNNGTSLHFHGIRQNYTNNMDGVNSITQCPTAPGSSVTYKWSAAQYGSSWYHSHYSLQAWEGVLGGIVIHGPAAGNFDQDLGVLFLNDWDHETVDQLYSSAETDGPPTLATGLINGTNIYDDAGWRFNTTMEEGKSHLIRLINGAADTHFDFMIDNHTLEVIATDFVPIVPYYTDVVSIGIGQRYDIIVTANMSDVASDFWMRAIPDSACSENDNTDGIRGVLHYGDSSGTPTTSALTYTARNCAGEPSESIVPYLALDAGDSASSDDLSVAVAYNDANLYKWYIGGSTFLAEYQDPTALQVLKNGSFSSSDNVIELSLANEWYYLVIETTLDVPHPIHLHGHDFYQLASGTGTYASSNATLSTTNPPRRDTSMLPGSGYLVIGFVSDNPGAWLCHCHIAWHTSEGFALQFVERRDEMAELYDTASLQSACDTWDEYVSESGLEQDDSGVQAMRHDSCRQCTKRRIKCDQGTPECAKCLKKNIKCSGVGKQYRFVEDSDARVAKTSLSRQRRLCQKDQQRDSNAPSDISKCTTTSLTQLQSSDNGDPIVDADVEAAVVADGDVDVSVSFTSPSYTEPSFDDVARRGPAHQTISLATTTTGVHFPLRSSLETHNPEQLMLFEHFEKVIAPYMVIFDAENNGFRNLILPLACRDSLVLRAISVVSGLHLGIQRPGLRSCANAGRAAILSRLGQDATKGSVDKVLSLSTWATLVILLIGETVTGSPDFVYLFAMLRSLLALPRPDTLGSCATSRFLDHQKRLFLLLVPPLLGETGPIEPWSASEDHLIEFFGLSPAVENAHQESMRTIKRAFQLTHTLIVQQNAALLPEILLDASLEQLRRLVEPIGNFTKGAHSLVWVYFVAAAESSTSDHREFFRNRLAGLYEVGRFGNIPVALSTLDKIWALDRRQRWTRETAIIAPVLVI